MYIRPYQYCKSADKQYQKIYYQKQNFNKLKKDENANISIIINNNTSNDSNSKNSNNNKKVIFECSETNGTIHNVATKNMLKKKRLRKNNQQLGLLSKFYNENKNWTKGQIKEISEIIISSKPKEITANTVEICSYSSIGS